MEIWGLTAADYTNDESPDADTVYVWPDNVPAVNVFVAMGTQWRVSHGGAYGLDYSALPTVMRLQLVPRSDWPEVFDSVRTMEDAALEEMRKT